MKCAIFCLLGFCAFQTVFADQLPKGRGTPRISREETTQKFSAVLSPLEKHFWDAARAVNITGISYNDIIENCMIAAEKHNGFNQKYDTATDQCDQCYDKADETKNIKVANECCDKIVAAFMTVAKLSIDKSVTCVAKCVKLGTGCKKVLKELGA